ncbi:conserved hypothetical protein [Vibrio nigripulchritudo SOn1]|uniref:Transposase n=1 Tax=Vibrio nigripulchritudo SOn1 TaxID=1238450 RepID=A0AAV2VT57_9VIBR|nr:conserved hypothetical protein [Vibrio nigripulchritudo SOn1]
MRKTPQRWQKPFWNSLKTKPELVGGSTDSRKQKRSVFRTAFLFQLLQAINPNPIQGYL